MEVTELDQPNPDKSPRKFVARYRTIYSNNSFRKWKSLQMTSRDFEIFQLLSLFDNKIFQSENIDKNISFEIYKINKILSQKEDNTNENNKSQYTSTSGAGVSQCLLLPYADVDVPVVVVPSVDRLGLDAVLLQSNQISWMVVVHVPTVELGLGVDPTNKRSGSCGRGGGCRCGGRFNWCHEIVEDLAFGDSVGHVEATLSSSSPSSINES